MSEAQEPKEPKDQSQSYRVPSWAWPWICSFIGSACAALFIDNRTLRSEIKQANDDRDKAKNEIIERERRDNMSIRKQNEMLTRLLYTSENMSKWLYTDSVVVANRAAAIKRQQSADADGESEGAD